MDESRWPRTMVPLSLIFFRVPVSSSASAGVLHREAARAMPTARERLLLNMLILTLVVMRVAVGVRRGARGWWKARGIPAVS
ncbi:hypothetical protein D3C78_1729690 [compost metagenome]